MTDAGVANRLEGALRRFAGLRIWVIGDVMLDEYVSGDVARISPEAPVQVVRVRSSERRLGGAANLANNVAALGAQAALCGVIGDDAAGDEVLSACARRVIDARALVRVAGRDTTRKVRLVSRRQQLVRMDWESDGEIPDAVTMPALDTLAAGPPPHALVISDYAKGFVSTFVAARAIALGRRLGVPVVVDPKSADLGRYRGATVIKPNAQELAAATRGTFAPGDLAALDAAAREALRQCGARAVVVTAGELGIAVVEPGAPLEMIPAEPREVFDVTGAGDTVAAVLTLALAAGADLRDAARLANAAAGVVVGRMGTAVAEPHEIRAALSPGRREKVLTLPAVAAVAARWRREGHRLVFTNGCFDLLHAGHLALLRAAAAHGDRLLVAINSDASVRRLKGSARPVVPAAERLEIIAALECVDAVVAFDDDTPLELIHAVRPDVLVKGADYRVDEVVGRAEVEGWGGKVVLVPVVDNRSTSDLIDRIATATRSGPS